MSSATAVKSEKAFRGPEARESMRKLVNGGLGLLGLYILTGAIIIGVFFAVLFGCLVGLIAILAAINGVVSWAGAGAVLLTLLALAVMVIGFGFLFGAKWATP